MNSPPQSAPESKLDVLSGNGTDFHIEFEFNTPRSSNHQKTIANILLSNLLFFAYVHIFHNFRVWCSLSIVLLSLA